MLSAPGKNKKIAGGLGNRDLAGSEPVHRRVREGEEEWQWGAVATRGWEGQRRLAQLYPVFGANHLEYSLNIYFFWFM